MNKGLKSFNEQFLIIGKDDFENQFDEIWRKYNSSMYDGDMSQSVIEDNIWWKFMEHKPSEYYENKDWVMEVIMNGWYQNGIHKNLSEVFTDWVDNNYEDLNLYKIKTEEVV